MAFPESFDSLPRPSASAPLSNPSHTQVHAGLATAIEALEAKVGIDGSDVESSHDFKIRALEGSVEEIQAELDGFDPDVTIADVEGLQAALDGKATCM